MMPPMNKLGMAVLIAGALVGCGGAQKGSSTKDACMTAATNVGSIFKREMGGEVQGIDEALPKIQQVFADHCVADKWSPDAIACIGGAADHVGLDACEPKITKAQQDAIKADMEGVLGGMKGMGGDEATQAAPGGGEGGGGAPDGDGATSDPCGGGE